MIPLSLTIEGLYSYRQRQHIDFETLSSNGLFGIFGRVGSGKSSILEALMFVLFDDTERLNKSGDDRYYNMLNLQSRELYIEFIFKAGPENGKKYRAVCKAKRSNNPEKFEEVKIGKDDRRYYEWQGGDWMPLEGLKDASTLLAMEYKHFRQTVIIPQGRFRDFIDQTSGERTKMLKELFQLQQYDLAPQTGRLQKQTEMQLENLRGQLQNMGELSAEALQQLQLEAQQADLRVGSLQHQHDQIYSQDKQLEELRRKWEQIDQTELHLKRLQSNREHWQQRSERLLTYRNAYTHFWERLRQQAALAKELSQKQEELAQLQAKSKAAQAALAATREGYQQSKDKWEKRDEIKASCDDLERILLIKEKEEQLSAKQQQLQRGQQQLAVAETAVKELEKGVKAAETCLHALEDKGLDGTRLTEAHHWHKRCQELQRELQREEESCKELEQLLQGVAQNRRTLINGYEFLLPDHDWELVFTNLGSKCRELEKQLEALQLQKQELAVQQELSRFARQLQQGGSCPLCGSDSHPKPLQVQHMQEALQTCEEALKKHQQENQQMRQLEVHLQQLRQRHELQQQTYQQGQNRLHQLKTRYAQHQGGYAWPEYQEHGLEQLEKLLQEAQQHQQQLKEARLHMRSQRERLEQQQQACEGLRTATQAVEKEWERLQAEHQTLSAQVHETRQGWLKLEVAKLQGSLQRGRQQYQDAIRGYELAQQALQQAEQQYNQLQGSLGAQQRHVAQLQQKCQQEQQELEQLCRTHGFISLEAIKEILRLRLDVEKEQEAIDAYYQELNTTSSTLEHLKLQTDGQQYQAAAHRELQQQLSGLTRELEAARKEKITKERAADEMQKQLEKQADLLKKSEALEIRLANLKELSGLFRGSGFVDWVSTMHLQDLCRAANERFFKLTSNSLSLELNESNNFIVRDHLNAGKTRLLKTLSGGQSFQAALCLALAMAENVKSLNGADQSFFFLDEGFGSLDKESLRIVFDTLKSLRQENRIVGIISHVEELQQEIDLYLNVENTEETGSVVACSWQGADA
ncbi:SbcC/MukB-like Walker B domain-containing protein [Cesiribacter andamanensis]|uniref:Nuclease sbcCD subunit C n=1 Tax=Cesiribacter andamanensis AMV16 TaxID=1279009 RepID=M7N434_9BACT|nr:SMC family ATPase [Cesiribacter andamanensis]EMR02052.1 Nuclease sbcCD subunit C [Cesiribacter andamanensis AMV16]